MNRIFTIAKKEFITAFKDRVFLVMGTLFLLMSIASVYIGSTTKNAELQAYENIVAVLQAQGGTIPAEPQIYPLVILHNMTQYIVMLGAVLAIFLGFDTFGGERESGTLQLIYTRPLTRGQFLIGKLLGVGQILGMLLASAFVCNTILFVLVTRLLPNLQELARLLLFILAAFFYMMAFYTASLLVSIKSGERSYVFLIMMIIWIFISFVVPQMADIQRDFVYAIDNVSGVLSQTSNSTMLSDIIEIFSPAIQFQHLGDDLLQVVPETATISVFEVLLKNIVEVLYLVGLSIVLFILSCFAVCKEKVEVYVNYSKKRNYRCIKK